MDVLKIRSESGAWNDYSKYIQRAGLGWKRNDLDSEKTVRVKDGRMRRDKITTKRTCSITMMPMSKALTAQLDEDLSQTTYHAIYDDLHGIQEREFYTSSFSAGLVEISDGVEQWEGVEFDMIEV